MRSDGLRIKFSSKCARADEGCRRRALKRSDDSVHGGYDTYCREHKREAAREYMRKRRAEDPTYGQGRYR